MLLRFRKQLAAGSAALVFCVQLYRGLFPTSPAPGEMAGGAANEPYVVVFAAIFSALVAWGLLTILFRLLCKTKK